MSDLRFIEQLGEEFERIAKNRAAGRRGQRWLRTRAPRVATGRVGVGLSLLIVVGVVAVVLSVHPRGPSGSAAGGRGLALVFRASPLDAPSALGPSIDRAVKVVRLRLRAAFGAARVSRQGDAVVVDVKGAPANRVRLEALMATTGRLAFYDWEANALTPSGVPVARLLQRHDPAALAISEGPGAMPGSSGTGGIALYQAVKLASRQPPEPASEKAYNARPGPQYYMFGTPDSRPCQLAARQNHTEVTLRTHCLLSGPAGTMDDLLKGLPAGVRASQGQTLVVPQGIVVLQAAGVGFPDQLPINEPGAQFFVLKDHVALSGADITKPKAGADPAGLPDLTFGFTPAGANKFHGLTGAIARRGDLASGPGQTLNQHFAVALDDNLLTVPSIDFKSYPDGVSAENGADVVGGLTRQSARDLAIILRFGPLPVKLTSH